MIDSSLKQALYADLKRYRLSRKMPWFDKPWDLNLFILRDNEIGSWRDRIVGVTVDDRGHIVIQSNTASSDASAGEWANPTHPKGCVWVAEQHVPGGYVLGQHNKRIALRQRKPFKCVRWPPSMGRIPTVAELRALVATHGFVDNRSTNLHNRASGRTPDAPKLNDTEGCPINLYYHEHIALMELVIQQRRFRGSAVVSPTFAMLADAIRPRLLGAL